jgi:hypothetical protein
MADFVSGSLQGTRKQLNGVIDQAIDRFAGHVPGCAQYSDQAKQTISGALDTLQQQLEKQVASQASNLSEKAPGKFGDMPGNIFGGGKSQ